MTSNQEDHNQPEGDQQVTTSSEDGTSSSDNGHLSDRQPAEASNVSVSEEGSSNEGKILKEESPQPVTLSAEEFQALKGKIEALSADVADNRGKYLRALADFENYKKRVLKERSDLLKYQGEKIFYDILEVVDNLDLALAHENTDPANLRAGLELIHKRFREILHRWDVRGASAVGKEFDPNIHNAISKIKVGDAKPGTIINELKLTYFYKDKLLRPGEVVVVEGEAMAAESVAVEGKVNGQLDTEDSKGS